MARTCFNIFCFSWKIIEKISYLVLIIGQPFDTVQKRVSNCIICNLTSCLSSLRLLNRAITTFSYRNGEVGKTSIIQTFSSRAVISCKLLTPTSTSNMGSVA